MIAHLSQFNCSIKWVKGSTLTDTDALSRIPVDDTPRDDFEQLPVHEFLSVLTRNQAKKFQNAETANNASIEKDDISAGNSPILFTSPLAVQKPDASAAKVDDNSDADSEVDCESGIFEDGFLSEPLPEANDPPSPFKKVPGITADEQLKDEFLLKVSGSA